MDIGLPIFCLSCILLKTTIRKRLKIPFWWLKFQSYFNLNFVDVWHSCLSIITRISSRTFDFWNIEIHWEVIKIWIFKPFRVQLLYFGMYTDQWDRNGKGHGPFVWNKRSRTLHCNYTNICFVLRQVRSFCPNGILSINHNKVKIKFTRK